MTYTPAKRLLRVFSLVITALFVSAPALFAAEDSAGSDSNALKKWVLDGGWPMILIALAIIALLALSVFNFINLTKPKFCPDDLRAALLDHMMNCRVRSAIELSASHPSYLGRMLAYSLPNIDATKPEDLGRDGVEDAIADFTINESRKNMVWINYIALIAQAAPMLGLFGTVYGMVNAFGILSATGAAEPAELAGDIQVALLTTFWGLLTAIPSLVAYFFFKNKLNNLVADAHHISEELVNASIQTVNQDAYLAKIPEGIAV
jgi:biopolymer transport protein ExbB